MLACDTRYPIILIHGLGFRDRKILNYWGRIPRALKNNGARVFYGGQDAWGEIERNSRIIKSRILDALKRTKSEKINIIAHSKGGLEARYMISRLKMSNRVASLTTISTPHHGLKTMDVILAITPKSLLNLAGVFVNSVFWLSGDYKPSFNRTCRQLTTRCCKKFNRAVKNKKGVYYQSYAAVMKKPYSDLALCLSYLIIKLFDGDNDGMVSVKSAKWGDFKGVISSGRVRGVSHIDTVDGWRTDAGGMDMRDVYIGIVKGLKGMGF